MKYLRLLYLFWLLPAYMLLLALHQTMVYQGLTETFKNGESYMAEVTDFEIKQIAAQTNGYVVLKFTPGDQPTIERKLSLPVQLASLIYDLKLIPVRYKSDSFEDIVMVPTYRLHKEMVLTNIAVCVIGFGIAFVIAYLAHRYVRRKSKSQESDTPYTIERID